MTQESPNSPTSAKAPQRNNSQVEKLWSIKLEVNKQKYFILSILKLDSTGVILIIIIYQTKNKVLQNQIRLIFIPLSYFRMFQVRKRTTGKTVGSNGARPVGGNGGAGDNMWKFYSEDSPGVKVRN